MTLKSGLLKLALKRSQPRRPPNLAKEAVAKFNEHGTLGVQNALPTDLLERVASAFEKEYLNLSNRELKERDAAVGDQRFMIKKQFNDTSLFANPRLMPILESLLSQHPGIASFGAVVAWPGAGPQTIHLDHPPLFDQGALCDTIPPYALTVVVPLVDVTTEMGATAIWPGSHRSPNRPDLLRQLMEAPDFSSSQQNTTNLGDAYLMDYRVIHAGMANECEKVRPILYLIYACPWFRDGPDRPKTKEKVPQRWRGLFAE